MISLGVSGYSAGSNWLSNWLFGVPTVLQNAYSLRLKLGYSNGVMVNRTDPEIRYLKNHILI